jgi:hypothetical protein
MDFIPHPNVDTEFSDCCAQKKVTALMKSFIQSALSHFNRTVIRIPWQRAVTCVGAWVAHKSAYRSGMCKIHLMFSLSEPILCKWVRFDIGAAKLSPL